jgi:hypothetical protein
VRPYAQYQAWSTNHTKSQVTAYALDISGHLRTSDMQAGTAGAAGDAADINDMTCWFSLRFLRYHQPISGGSGQGLAVSGKNSGPTSAQSFPCLD